MQRQDALILLKEKIKNQNLIKHSLAVEAGLKELAEHFGEPKDIWGIAGLLHDLDYEETKNDSSKHGIITAQMLKGKVDDQILYAIKVHADKAPPLSTLDWALYAVDPLTGLIVASCLMHPEKKLEYTDTEFILHRFDEKKFAAGASRDQIKSCENLGITLDEFVDLTLTGMQNIHEELGL